MYAKIVSGSITKTGRRPRWYQDNPDETDAPVPVTDEQLAQAGWLPVIFNQPDYDPATHAVELNDRSEWIIQADLVEATYTLRELTSEELANIRAMEREEARQAAATLLNSIALEQVANDLVDNSEDAFEIIEAVAAFFPDWEPDTAVEVGDRFYYQGQLLEVITAHTTQAGWQPDQLPALYKVYRAPGEIAPWVQPIGAQDAYSIGDQVTHNGQTWTSTHDDNVWEPGVFGWEVE